MSAKKAKQHERTLFDNFLKSARKPSHYFDKWQRKEGIPPLFCLSYTNHALEPAKSLMGASCVSVEVCYK